MGYDALGGLAPPFATNDPVVPGQPVVRYGAMTV